MADRAAHHPEETVVTGKAGSVLVFNGHLWHGGTQNRSKKLRRALQCVFHAVEVIRVPSVTRREIFSKAIYSSLRFNIPHWRF